MLGNMWFEHRSVLILVIIGLYYGKAVEIAQTKIIGGRDAYRGQFKFPVSLRVPSGHICGGALIRNDTVLTAAHCVYNNANPRSYRVGVDMLKMHENDQNRTLEVTKIIIHNKYNSKTQANDIAVLKVRPLVKKNTGHSGIPIPLNTSPIKNNTTCTVLGWGDTVPGTNKGSLILQYVDVPLVSKKNCSKIYGAEKLPTNTVCAGMYGKDSCQGDSGGPLICGDKLVGVVSFGISCGSVYPGVYTDVSKYTQWIKEAQNNAPQLQFMVYVVILTIIGNVVSQRFIFSN